VHLERPGLGRRGRQQEGETTLSSASAATGATLTAAAPSRSAEATTSVTQRASF